MSYCRILGVKSAWWGQAWFGCVLLCVNADIGVDIMVESKPGLGVCFHVLLQGHCSPLSMGGGGQTWFGCVPSCYCRVIRVTLCGGGQALVWTCAFLFYCRVTGVKPALACVCFHLVRMTGSLCRVGESSPAFMRHCGTGGHSTLWGSNLCETANDLRAVGSSPGLGVCFHFILQDDLGSIQSGWIKP